MIYRCCDERRRQAVLDSPNAALNGIDFLEVVDASAPDPLFRQRLLLLRFLKPAPLLGPQNIEITGGERIPEADALLVTRADAPDASLPVAVQNFLTALDEPDHVLAVHTDTSGDYSRYTLHLVASSASLSPPPDIDPLLARVPFSFKVECPTDFDCRPERVCPEDPDDPPVINYLAKDYRSFRRLMLERMAQIMPDWTERNAADLGITMVELLAYVGDRLSYRQDAVGTEAYLHTARRRSSVRRLARMVDYFMHDGANARAWVQVQIAGPSIVLAASDTKFLTRVADAEARLTSLEAAPLLEQPAGLRPGVFEPMHDQALFEAHNEMDFYTWGDSECCLPRGATRATLAGSLTDLVAGDVLVFEEVLGPRTGREADADPNKRHAVRLVQVDASVEDPVTVPATAVTEIRWAEEDALPFALCLSARTTEDFGSIVVAPVSRVLGNIVLADHGLTVTNRPLGTVPDPHLYLVPAPGEDRCDPEEPTAVPPRFRPAIEEAPLTQAADYQHPPVSAFAATRPDPASVEPVIVLTGTTPTGDETWTARRDLLPSDHDDTHFVVEVERDGQASLRFGDDRHGRRPESGTIFAADHYRIGNGPSGNLGAEALVHVASDQGGIVGVRNPLPASGGRAPESMAEVREAAPFAYRTQERAVTQEDYAAVSLRHPDVQRAAATFRWNGHGHTVFVTVDRFGNRPITPEFEAELIDFLEPFRMAGYDLEIDAPRFVSVELEIRVCVSPEHFRADVRQAVRDALSNRDLPDGRRGLFHPDNLTFAQDIYLSAIYAAVQDVEGVESVDVVVFQRQDVPDPVPLESGVLPVDRLEIPRLDNDPDFPEHGVLRLIMGGGK